MSKLQVKRINKYNLLSLFYYLNIRFQVFAKENKRGIWGEFYLEDFKGNHYIFLSGKKVIGVARVINRGDIIEFGRIAIKKEYRKLGYGTECVKRLIGEIKKNYRATTISLFAADKSLTKFYKRFGFIENGEVYFGNTPYINMIKSF